MVNVSIFQLSSKFLPDDHCPKRICPYLRRCGALYDGIFCTHVVYFVTIKMGPNLFVVVAKGPVLNDLRLRC